MIADRLNELPLDELDLLIVENVGNLICPAGFMIGADADAVVLSLTEGPEKPLKYPAIFQTSRIALVNKIDLAEVLEIELDTIKHNIEKINPKLEKIFLSAKTGEGFDTWIKWIEEHVREKKGL
jgi:hydrogenase nickel incorporation protein HypB